MFLGDFEHSLDEKNRVVLPSPFRRGLADQVLEDCFYLVPSDGDQCLELHPRASWERYVQDLKERHDLADAEWREFLRDLYSSACELQLDKQYRFPVPDATKSAAGIDREVYFVGMGEFVEIWDRGRWVERREARKGKRRTPSSAKVERRDA
jgi:MraZ protein